MINEQVTTSEKVTIELIRGVEPTQDELNNLFAENLRKKIYDSITIGNRLSSIDKVTFQPTITIPIALTFYIETLQDSKVLFGEDVMYEMIGQTIIQKLKEKN